MAATHPKIAAESPRFGHRLEAWGAALIFGIFGLLPIGFASSLGEALGRRIGPFLGISKRARINLSKVTATYSRRVSSDWAMPAAG